MKIRPQELRIGNWVKWSNEKEPNEVPWAHGHWLGVFEKNYDFPEPISLTVDWLTKFGFELKEKRFYPKEPCSFYIQMNGLRINDSEFETRFYIGQEFTEHIPDVSTIVKHQLIMGTAVIRYVHQLQNLWFALLNDELTIQS